MYSSRQHRHHGLRIPHPTGGLPGLSKLAEPSMMAMPYPNPMDSTDTLNLNARKPESGPVRPDHAQEVRVAQIRLLYQHTPSALIATLINAAIMVFVLWEQLPAVWLIGWFVAIALVVLGRFGLLRVYFSARPLAGAESRRWEHHYLFGVALNGVLWGIAGFFFFIGHSSVHQLFLAFVLAGMTAGSVTTLSAVRGAYLAFLAPALLPYGIQLVSHGGEVHLAMAAMLLLFISMMAIISTRLHRTVEESLRLRFDNLDLLNDLKLAKDRQELANRELAAQIEARRHAQDALQKSYAELEQRVRERTEKLAQSEEALREANGRKDEFLAMLSHELRNPLAPIRNAVQIMHKPGASDAALEQARAIIDRQVDHLARLVDDLLDVSRIVRGKILLQETVLDLATIIDQAVEVSRPLIKARRHELTVSIPEEPLRVKGDLVRLAQVISNLLNNAAKYTDTGGKIELKAEAAGTWVRLSVRDNGVGIPAALLPHIFDLFTQADHSPERAQGGLGIGLTLVKRLVEMHGGRIEVRSAGPGQGTEFLMWLPRCTADAG
jgi:signal transduction histidine kinase